MTKKRDAKDLAELLERHPQWTNELGHLEALEIAAGNPHPAPWVADPRKLLADARRHMVYPVGENGNFLVK